MKTRRVITSLLLTLSLLAGNAIPVFAMPPLPSSFHGSILVGGANAEVGAVLSARINDVQYAYTYVMMSSDVSVYAMDVRGDDPETEEIDGGVTNDLIHFYLDGQLLDQTARWRGGTNPLLNLTLSINMPPIITEGASTTLTTPEDTQGNLTLHATDSNGDDITWSILDEPDHGDAAASGTGASKVVTYNPDANYNGSDSFTVQVSDGNSGTDTILVNVTVTPANDAPVITQGTSITLTTPEDTLGSLTLNATDVDAGDVLTWSISSPAGHGTASASGTGASKDVSYDPADDYSGSDTFTVQVLDGNTGTDTILVNVTVTSANDAPIITEGASTSLSTAEDTAGSITLHATDVEGNTLTWGISTPAGHGAASTSGTGASKVVTYNPAANYNGSDTFTVQVSDGNSGTDTILVNVTVTPANDAPTCLARSLTTDQDTPAGVAPSCTDPEGSSLTYSIVDQPVHGSASFAAGMLSYDPDGTYTGQDSFTYRAYDGELNSAPATVSVTVTGVNHAPVITQGTSTTLTTPEDTLGSLTLNATDVDAGDVLTWSISDDPDHGTASASGTGTSKGVSYDPADNFNGSDTFVVRVTDSLGATDSITINVTVTSANDAPVITEGTSTSLSTAEDTSKTLTLNATDVDAGDVLTWSISTPAGHGTASASGTGASKVVTYNPAANYNGSDTFVVQVTDSFSATDTITINVTVTSANDAPVITEGASITLTTAEDTSKNLTLNATDADASDVLTWSISTTASHGTASASGTGASKVVSYNPDTNFNGSDSFAVRVTDSLGATDTITVNVTVNSVNDAPTCLPRTITTDQETTTGVAPSCTDPESSSLIYSIVDQPLHGSASLVSGLLTYDPDGSFTGQDPFTYRAYDTESYSAPATVSVTVTPVNHAPIITEGTSTSLTTPEDTLGSLTLNATDVDAGDVLTWSISTQAANGTASASGTGASKIVSYNPNTNFNGTDSFAVRVTDSLGATDTITVNVTVSQINDPPVITEGPTETAIISEDASHSGTLHATDADTEDVLTWSISDQADHGTATASGTGYAKVVSYEPVDNYNGPDSFVVEVSDGAGGVDTITITVTVMPANDAPVITEGPSASLSTAEDTAGSITLHATDVEGNTLTWGISAQATNGTASASGTGTSKDVSYDPNDNFNGTDSFTVQVSDGNSGTDTILVNVTVTPANDAPTCLARSLTTDQDTPAGVAPSCTDPEGSSLTYSIVDQPVHGSASFAAGMLSYDPDGTFTGQDSFTYRAYDGEFYSASAVVSVTVTPVNHAPVITQGTSTTLTTPEDTLGSLTLNATDVDAGDVLTWSISDDPDHGTASASGTGTSIVVSYDPADNYFGTDSFTVQVLDGHSGTDTILVNVTVTSENDAPVITEGPTATGVISEDGSHSGTLHATDGDPGDVLTWSISDQAEHGTASASGAGTSKVVTYEPVDNYNGSDTYVVQVSDVDGATDTIIVTITVIPVNDAPVITEGTSTSLSTAEDTAGSITLHAADVEGHTLTWSISAQATNGTATASGTGTSKDVSYDPNDNFNGTDSFTVQVSDGNSGTDTILVNVTVTPAKDAPVCLARTITTDQDSLGEVSPSCTDVDGDSLTYSIVDQPVHGSASFAAGMLRYDPDGTYTGQDSFTYRAFDGELYSASAVVSVTVTPVNVPPVITESSPQLLTTDEDTPESLTLHATDPNGDTLTWSISDDPDHGTASASGTGTSIVVSYDPADNYFGSDSFTVRVSDNDGLTDTITVNVTVTQVNDPPVITQGSAASLTTAEDTDNSLTLSASDPEGNTLTWNISTQAGHGTASASGTGTSKVVSYDPNNNFHGTDSFIVRVSDGNSGTDTITINVTVTSVNDPPVITEGPSTSLTTDEDIAKNISLHVTDVDGGETFTWIITNQGDNGTANVLDGGVGDTVEVNYAPEDNFNGSDSFDVRVSDGHATDTITVNVTVNPVNDIPVCSERSMDTDQNVTVEITLACTDVDDTSFVYSIVEQPDHGDASIAGDKLSYTPDTDFVGTDHFKYQAFDGEDSSPEMQVTVNVANHAPVIGENSPAEITMSEDGAPTPFLLTLHATDGDEDVLTWSVLTPASHGTAAVSGTGSSKLIGYTPTANYHGGDSFVVQVADDLGGTDKITVVVSILPVNDAPVLAVIDPQSVTQLETLSFTAAATDVDLSEGEHLVFSLAAGAPAGATIDAATGVFSWTPGLDVAAGEYNLTVQVSDQADPAQTDTQLVTITVIESVPEPSGDIFLPLVITS